MHNYRASGIGKCPSELFRYALLPDDDPEALLPPEADVAGHLAWMLNVVFNNGRVPDDWNTVSVSPFKSVDRGDLTNYRLFSVGVVFPNFMLQC